MSGEGSVTHWFEELERGNSAAAQPLWERYFPQLVRLARDRLRGARHGAADEEDVALSVMESFFDAAQQQRFPNLADRDDLWRLLLRMTARKTVDLRRHEARQRRGGGRVHNEAELAPEGESDDGWTLAQTVGNMAAPDFAAMMAEECSLRLRQLEDAGLQSIAVLKMQSYTNSEIAAQLGCSIRTIERRLELIRRKWAEASLP